MWPSTPVRLSHDPAAVPAGVCPSAQACEDAGNAGIGQWRRTSLRCEALGDGRYLLRVGGVSRPASPAVERARSVPPPRGPPGRDARRAVTPAGP
ncbi:hypothetical protein GCM10018787_01850 [Streptomyces thermodiastaticus]|nr:hypothetical protein GCM10018787_01850 [Streptomyces thermodiastaticus]